MVVIPHGKVAFIFVGTCHPVSREFVGSLNADSYCISKGPLHSVLGICKAFLLACKLKKYEIYFLESAMSIFVPVFKRFFGEKNIIIFRGNDGLFGEKTGTYLDSSNPLKRWVLRYLISKIDAVSTESKMAAQDIKNIVPLSVPLHVAKSYVSHKEKLLKISPNLSTKKFLFVGAYRPPGDHKGCRLLLNVFADLEKDGCQLTMIGPGTETLIKYAPGNVTLKGYVKDLFAEYEKHTYLIHLGRYETGPITLLEGSMAGMVVLSSDHCGHHSVLDAVDKRLILPISSPAIIANLIRKRLAWSDTERKKIGIALRNQVKGSFGKKEMVTEFKKGFWELVEKVRQKQT